MLHTFKPRFSLIPSLIAIVVLALGVASAPAAYAATNQGPPVTLTQSGGIYTLSNGILTARIEGKSAAILTMTYKGIDLLGQGYRENGYWSMPGTHYHFGPHPTVTIIDNPAKNGGARATIGIQFNYDGGAETVPADVGIHYSLARGGQALYLEEIWNHKPSFPKLSFPVGRIAVKLNDSVFDWMTINAKHNLKMITAYDWDHGITLNLKEARRMTTGIKKGEVEHKYDYSAVQFNTPAYGWSSTKRHVGIWMITPNYDYMSGGPTKLELTSHRDATFTHSLTAPAPPVLLYLWKGAHYGGTSLFVPKGQEWTKTIGPFLLYVNSGPTHDAMWHNALARASRAAKNWPYAWAVGPGYPPASKLGGLTGKIVLHDPQAPNEKMTHLLVGLTHPKYTLPSGRVIGWQRDSKYYQYWTRGKADGDFTIADVRPGTYTLHAFADGVLGEYAQAHVTIHAGKTMNAGTIVWTPIRYGKQLWSIGIPNRTASEFLHGNNYWHWGIYYQYPKDFPHNVTYVIGKSNFHKDWNIMQVPRAKPYPARWGTATTWSVVFNLHKQQHGKATLRLAFAGTEAHSLTVTMNGKVVGVVSHLPNTDVIHRDSDRGYWFERDVSFDASLLKKGKNVLQLTVPAGPVTAGVEYDYLRLAVANKKFPAQLN